MSEWARLMFLERRDGDLGAYDFAKRALKAYRSAARPVRDGRNRLMKQWTHDKLYCSSFAESLWVLRAYIRLWTCEVCGNHRLDHKLTCPRRESQQAQMPAYSAGVKST